MAKATNEAQEPVIPEVSVKKGSNVQVDIPIPFVRFLTYCILFLILLVPDLLDLNQAWRWLSHACILAHFASFFNGWRNDK